MARIVKYFSSMNNNSGGKNIFFDSQWSKIKEGKGGDFSMFTPRGEKPKTQKQFNNFYYYQLINRLISGKGCKSCVEFGCGRGTLSLFLNLYNGIDATLLDISSEAISLAKANFDFYGGNGAFIVADSAKTPLPSDCFDLVASMGLLEHLPDYGETLKEMHRVLKPGGMLISMNVPKKTSVQALNGIYLALMRMLGIYKGMPSDDCFRVGDKPEDFLKMAEAAGFKDCRIIHANPFPRLSPVPKRIEKMITGFYRIIMGFRRIYKKDPMETGRRLSQCHFLTALK